MTTATETTPRVWIGCLASYNAGRLIGEWVDATDLAEMLETQEEVKAQAIAAAKEAGEWPVYFTEPEEFFLADHEGFPPGTIGEYTPLEKVAELGALIEEKGEAFGAFLGLGIVDAGTSSPEELGDAFDEAYCGEFATMKDYAYETVAELGWAGLDGAQITETSIESYLDYDMIARELEQDYSEEGGYVFRTT